MSSHQLLNEETNKKPITPQDSPYDSPFSSPPPIKTPPPPPSPKPSAPQMATKTAQLPKPDKNKNQTIGTKQTNSITTSILVILAIIAVAGATAFFLRSQFLKNQLQSLISTKKNQQTASPTPAPTFTPAKVPQTSPSPTPISTISPQATFPYLPEVIKIASKYQQENQLLMITADNAQSPYQIQIKYWFRTQDSNKANKYFYILRQPAKDLELFDKLIYVTPDNNIPDLKAEINNQSLGSDLDQVLKTAREQVLDNSSIEEAPDTIYAQYLKTDQTLLWQLVYNYLNKTTPVIIQVNAQTQEIIYTNINYNKPQEEKN